MVSGDSIQCAGSTLGEHRRRRGQEERERLRQLESDFAHINRVSMMGELAASLSHEIMQPIASARINACAGLNFLDKQPPDLGEVRQALARVVGTVRDSGPGIEPTHLERVFKPFYTTKSSGLGMGLSICRSIIEGHGGRLWADANEPRGAVFQFTLPGGSPAGV